MVRWLDERESQAWIGLLRLTARLQTEMNRQLTEEHGLSLTDYEVLARLAGSPRGGLRVRDLMQTLSWEQSRLSHHLSRMHKRGLVAREDAVEDRRGALFVLTVHGRQAIEQAAPSHVEHVRRLLFDRLSDEQVEQLREITARGLQGR